MHCLQSCLHQRCVALTPLRFSTAGCKLPCHHCSLLTLTSRPPVIGFKPDCRQTAPSAYRVFSITSTSWSISAAFKRAEDDKQAGGKRSEKRASEKVCKLRKCSISLCRLRDSSRKQPVDVYSRRLTTCALPGGTQAVVLPTLVLRIMCCDS